MSVEQVAETAQAVAKIADEFKERKGSTLMNWLIGASKDAVPVLRISGKFGVIIGNILAGFGEVLVKASDAFKVL